MFTCYSHCSVSITYQPFLKRLSSASPRLYRNLGDMNNHRKRIGHPNRQKSLLEAGILQLQNDKTNGARVLATNAVETLRSVVAANGSTNGLEFWQQIRADGYRLSISRPSMSSAITTAVIQALGAVKDAWMKELGSDWLSMCTGSTYKGQTLKDLATKRLEEVLHNRSQSSKLLGKHFKEYLSRNFADIERPLRILTLSSSSSLHQCLFQAVMEIEERQFELRVLESRPRCEGASFATKFLEDLRPKKTHNVAGMSTDANIRLVVAPESHVCMLAKDIDIVLLGADRISAAGDVSNKMGSFAAALCAKQLSPSVKVLLASESDKIAKPGSMSEYETEDNDPEEVIAGWDEDTQRRVHALDSNHLKVENIYFEWVPASYMDTYITENGAMDVSQIQEISAGKEKLERELFDEEIVALAQQS